MKKRIKIQSFILCVVMLFALTASTFAEVTLAPETSLTTRYPSRSFTDVKITSWYYDTMNTLVRAGGIDGFPDGSFKPGDGLKLSEFIKTVVSILYPDQLSPWEDYHIDGESIHWYSKYVGAAAYAGLLKDVDYSRTALEKPIDRYTMAKIMVNAASAMGSPLQDNPDMEYLIYDYEEIPETCRPYVRKAYGAGIINGMDENGTFFGDSGLKRSEACAAIVRLFDEGARVRRNYYIQDFGTHVAVVTAPDDWEDKVIVEPGYYENGSWLEFYCKASYYDFDEAGGAGILFAVAIEDAPTDFPESEYLGELGGKYVYIYYPSDVPCEESSFDAYLAMLQDMIDGLVNVMVFYKGDAGLMEVSAGNIQ